MKPMIAALCFGLASAMAPSAILAAELGSDVNSLLEYAKRRGLFTTLKNVKW